MDTKWTVTIQNNKTGETDVYNSNAILGCISANGGCHSVFMTECNTYDLAEVLLSADALLKKVRKAAPAAYALARGFYEEMQKEGVEDVD